MSRIYHYLTEEERAHFLEHGWLKVENAIKPKYVQEWMANLWTRLGYDANDKSTWKEEYIKLPRHREVPASEFCPDAWNKMVEIVGGEDKIDPVRERYYGDQFIINFGSEYWNTHETPPQEATGWHHDNDWYRQFLDSSGNALTIIHCFSDIPERGGGTLLAEDGIKGTCKDVTWRIERSTHCTKTFANISTTTQKVLMHRSSTFFISMLQNAINLPLSSPRLATSSSRTACFPILRAKITFTTLA